MQIRKNGLQIRSVRPNSQAYRAGLRKGDHIVSVNGEPIADELEFRFFSARPEVHVVYSRENSVCEAVISRSGGVDMGIIPVIQPIKKCANRCLFCFIDQMPEGLRDSLYVKDEDYRYSFTNGNYITLSNSSESELCRIAQLGLSPLYISVHATGSDVRKKLLGNRRTIDIMRQLRFLSDKDIKFHAQIVVCPGINDGIILEKTIKDLLLLKDGILSIAIVPVGLTRYHKNRLLPVNMEVALQLCNMAGRMGDKRVKAGKRRLVYCADELFIKARLSVPAKAYYDDYPQIENGVGLVRLLLEEWRKLKKNLETSGGIEKKSAPVAKINRYLVITSESASTYIKKITEELERFFTNVEIKTAAVANDFFGRSVTVAGLMTACDVMRVIRLQNSDFKCVFLPDVMFNINGYTLDGYSVKRIAKNTGKKVKIVSSIGDIVDYVGKR
jgi:putative radical SAM enzyme (TIGR03279 family)